MHTLTALGYGSAVVLMAVFVVVNYFGVRWFARINNALVWWKLAHHRARDRRVRGDRVPRRELHQPGLQPTGFHGVFTRDRNRRHRVLLPRLPAGHRAGRRDSNPKRNVPIAVIGSVLITAVIYILLQFAFIGPLEPRPARQGLVQAQLRQRLRPAGRHRHAARPGLARMLLYADAIVSPGDTGLIYTTVDLPDLLRDGPQRQRAAGAGRDDRPGRPAGRPGRWRSWSG